MRVIFVTDREDAHVQRFSDSFLSAFGTRFQRVDVSYQDGNPFAFVGETALTGWDALQDALGAEGGVVISGPLDTVTGGLVGGNYRHIGISWATDVMVTAAASTEALATMAATVAGLDLIVTDNYATENALIALGAEPSSVCRIPWGPQDGVGASAKRSDFGIADETRVILYPRSIEPHYQPEVFLDALEMVVASSSDVVAVLIDSGSQVEAFKEWVSQKGLGRHIVWQPVRPSADFAGLMALADVVVVTTVTDGTSVTVMDAMAQGIPVVASLTNGSAEWLMDGVTGWTFPVGDASALARALDRVLSAKEETRRLITANAQRLVAHKAGWARSEAVLIAEIEKLFTS
jgi:L-malate glycosyltransferase